MHIELILTQLIQKLICSLHIKNIQTGSSPALNNLIPFTPKRTTGDKQSISCCQTDPWSVTCRDQDATDLNLNLISWFHLQVYTEITEPRRKSKGAGFFP